MCGMRLKDDIAYAVYLGVDAIGLIFYDKSARNIGIEQAKQLLEGLPAFVTAVAVFVNPDVSLVNQVISKLPIQCLQFQGEETMQFCEQFGLPYIKAIQASSEELICNAVNNFQHARAILLDTPSRTCRGGTGVTFDWHIIPKQLTKAVILAGGLNADNVQAAIAACSPYAVDVCSGIEASAGVKDHVKMKQFVEAIRARE